MYSGYFESKYALVILLNMAVSVSGTGQKCLSCSYTSRPSFCYNFIYCEEGEICHIRKIMTRNAHTQYTSGCISDTSCSVNGSLHGSFGTPYGHVTCVECCHGDFCNNKGCGDPGPPTRDSRGPFCFQCNNMTSPANCQTLVSCSSDQVCSIKDSLTGAGTSVFTSGCVSQNTCSRGEDQPSNRCHSCCSTDYCNTECSTQTIV